ncbi:unnamed protein product [Caenorhabditis angaria]|uniref:CHCH domain-containing protein n=1 Tax=Caenorhabditis angaria TaxID=860376 RepID=A0A9P1IF76_9PELO|nr:unnamed protein product [Caenorhabditis angaria]
MSFHQILKISPTEFWNDIKNEYIQKLSNTPPDEVYPSNNPGPTLPNGNVNFECHCVSHLVASPCGYHFREAINCQKSTNEEDIEKGACGQQLLSFMECANRTQCFKLSEEKDEKK